MKRNVQRIVSLIALWTLLAVMSVGVHAEPIKQADGSLALTGSPEKTDSQYSLYRVAGAVFAAGQDVYGYEITKKFEDDITLEQLKAYEGKDGPADYQIDPATADALARDLENAVKTKNIEADYTISAEQAQTVEPGYYLILETKPTEGCKTIKPMLVSVPQENVPGDYTYDVTVTLKEQPLLTVKKIVKGNERVELAAQEAGREFIFEIVQDIPLYDDTHKTVTFQVTDTMAKGLTYQGVESVTVDGGPPLGADAYGVAERKDPTTGKTTVTFDFSDKKLDSVPGPDYYESVKGKKQVTIRYKAALNKDADFGSAGNRNTAKARFGTDKDGVTQGAEAGTATYSGALQITKRGENGDSLPGVEFTAYMDEDCRQEAALVTYELGDDGTLTGIPVAGQSAAVTDQNGEAKFAGLGEDTYYLRETDAPAGYVFLRAPIKVTAAFDKAAQGFVYTVEGNGVIENTVAADNGVLRFEVQNKKGFTLPSTGGPGAYPFLIGGALLTGAAVLLLLCWKRKED